MPVLVLGGGITGLSAAHALAKAGIQTTLVEASSRLGGKVSTETMDGFVVERGPDSFVSYRPAAVDLARELGLLDEIIAPREPRTVFVRAGGRFARLPEGMGLVLPTRLGPFVTTDLFSWPQKLRAGLDLLLPREVVRGDVAVGRFLERRLGRALVDRLAGPLIGGVYGTPIDQLSLDAVVPQLRDAERRHRSLLLASLADGRARRRSGRAPGSPFVSLRGGIGSLTDALAAVVRSHAGVDVRTGTQVATLGTTRGGVTARLVDGERIQADAVVVATPAPVAAAMLEAEFPAAARPLLAIPHGSTAVVSLAFRPGDVPPGLEGHGFLVAGGEALSITACTYSSRKWEHRAPDGWLLVRAYLGDRLAASELPDQALVDLARHDLAATVGLTGEPGFARVARHRHAMPHYTVGHPDRVAAATAALGEAPQVVLAGGAYRGIGLPDCITQGTAAAQRVSLLVGGFAAATAATAAPDPRADEHAVAHLSMAEAPPGIDLQVAGIAREDATDLALEGVGPGSRLVITAKTPLGGPVVARCGRARLAFPRAVARRIVVQPTTEGPR